MAGGMYGRECAWLGACMAGSMCGRGTCVAGGHVWWDACMAGGMHGGVQGAYMAGGVHAIGVCVAGGMHGGGCAFQEGMHGRRDGHCSGRYASYWNAFLYYLNADNFQIYAEFPIYPKKNCLK